MLAWSNDQKQANWGPGGDSYEASLSQDGRKIAWSDDLGVRIAGVSTTSADPCVFSSPPVTIAAGAQSPSIGGGDFSQITPSGNLTVSLPPRLKIKGLTGASGVVITVRTRSAGRVRVTGTVPASRLGLKGNKKLVVVSGSAVAGSAGPVKVRLRIVSRYRKYKARLKGATVELRIGQGSNLLVRRIKLG
ncbi:MAG: hypothetical protein WD181_05990 [Solirubrobacterales bacterium]